MMFIYILIILFSQFTEWIFLIPFKGQVLSKNIKPRKMEKKYILTLYPSCRIWRKVKNSHPTYLPPEYKMQYYIPFKIDFEIIF